MLSHSQTRIALGSPIHLTLISENNSVITDEIFRNLWLNIFEFELRFSRFLPDSELSEFNRSAGFRHQISPDFVQILHAAKNMATLTEGIYNPFILPALQRAGYKRSMVAAHSQDSLDDFKERGVPSMDRLEIGDGWACIPYNSAIDLGGCGKGYLGDLLADYIDSQNGINGYWLSLGGDIVARGCDQDNLPIVIQIDDLTALHTMAGERLTSGDRRYAVATSSVLRRRGVENGRKWHHLIDPRTNEPTNTDINTASVCAATSLLADVLASCAIILGIEKALDFLNRKGAEGVILQTKQKKLVRWGNLESIK
jgi:thiamine biosynthesis lipoprotein